MLNSENADINFNYDYPLKIEKFCRSNSVISETSVNKEIPKQPKQHILISESNSELLKNSQSLTSNQCKNIPRAQSVNNHQKNPEKELTYIESFSKDFKNYADNSKTSFEKNEDKKIMNESNSYSNLLNNLDNNNNQITNTAGNNSNNMNLNSNMNNIFKGSMNYNNKPAGVFPNNALLINPLNNSETLSVNNTNNQDSRQDTLKTVSISQHKNSFSREKKSFVSDKRGFLEHNITDNNYIQESTIMNDQETVLVVQKFNTRGLAFAKIKLISFLCMVHRKKHKKTIKIFSF